jgi:hypothetical protein
MPKTRIVCALLIIWATTTATVQAEWMVFSGGPAISIGTWPFGSALSGVAVATRSNVVNGIPNTPPIGLTPINVPNLSPDYFLTGLQPNGGPSVDMLGTPYNDSGDQYHVAINFSGTTGGSNPGVLPAGSIFAIIDLDILEDYRNVRAVDASGNPIVTPWISGPNAYFDMTNPMTPNPAVFFGSSPTLTGPVAGVYQMFGPSWNDDAEMWLFQTTQDVRVIHFDMRKSGPVPPAVGGGGAGWAFYTPRIPEPTTGALVSIALVFSGVAWRRRLAD